MQLYPTSSVVTLKSPMGGSGVDTRFDYDSARFYDLVRKSESDPVGLVVRLVTDGDERLPCTRVQVVKTSSSRSGKSERKSSAPVQKSVSTRKQNDEAARAVLAAMGYNGKITPRIRKAALDMIAIERSLSGGRV